MAERYLEFDDDPVTVAKRLLGQRLVHRYRGRRLAGTIVEVEAYLGAPDRAAHTFGGRRTPRNESMYLGGGHAYVYFTYGMHHCMNFVCGAPGDGVAVLLRAVEPTEGLTAMYRRRVAAKRDTDLCSGPGKLTEALAVDRWADGLDLRASDRLFVERGDPPPPGRIAVTPRVGVAYAGPWARRRLRFLIKDNPNVSRPRP